MRKTQYTYIRGDKAIYTGATEVLYNDLCFEVRFIEGHNKGNTAWTYRRPGQIGPYKHPSGR